LAFKSNEKSLTAYHAEGNSMASPTQAIVGKGKPNPLIDEDLLKILRDLILLIPPKFLKNSLSRNGRSTKSSIHFPNEINYKSKLSC